MSVLGVKGLKAKICKGKYEPKLEFPVGWGSNQKNPLWGEYGYFLEQHIISSSHSSFPHGCWCIHPTPLGKRFQLTYLHLIPQVKDKISESDRKMIVDKCNDVVSWLDSQPDASKDEYERRQKELESICNPIITKLYQGAGGAPPPGAGGFPQGGGASESSGGPTIEEVD